MLKEQVEDVWQREIDEILTAGMFDQVRLIKKKNPDCDRLFDRNCIFNQFTDSISLQ